ncbi:ROK family transcriptional regulator [Nonomuraea sp. NPDC003214]
MPKPTDALQRLRRAHEDAVLDALRSSGALSRTDLIRITGLSRTTLFTIISEMIERASVVETEAPATARRGRGRPATLVTLNPGAGQLIGLDLARRRIHLAVANLSHQIVATGMADVPEGADVLEQAEAAVRLVKQVSGERGVRLDALEAIGVGLIGGAGDPALPPARYAPVKDRLSREFGVRVAVDNNARLAALAESTWGAARPARDIVYARWSVGVGGGFLVGGRLVRGATGAAGELGHISLDPAGPPCHCGSRGCLEPRIGAQALLDACAAGGVRLDGLDALVAAARDRVPAVCEVISAAAADLGRVLADAVVQLDPERVVVGGELAALGSLVLGPIRESISRLALPRTPSTVEVVPADLGARASAMGAIALLLHDEPPTPFRTENE